MTGKLAIKGAIFCDDVREETNGKLTLVGTGSTSLLQVHNFPADMRLFTVLVADLVEIGEAPIRLELMSGDQRLVKVEGRVSVGGIGSALIHFGPLRFKIPEPGQLRLDSVVDDRRDAIATLEVSQAESSEADE